MANSSSAHPANLEVLQVSALDLLLLILLTLALGDVILPGLGLGELLQLLVYAEDPDLQPRPLSPVSVPNIQLLPQHLTPPVSLAGTLKQICPKNPPTPCSFYCVPCLK